MIPEGKDAAQVTEDEIRDVIGAAKLFIDRHKIKQSEIAKAIGTGLSTISEFLSGKIRNNSGQLAIDVDAWMDEEDRRRARPKTTQWVWTNVSLEIKQVAEYVLDYRKIGLVYSAESSGMGKTETLRAMQDVLGPRRSTLVTLDKSCRNGNALLRRIGNGLGVLGGRDNHELMNRIIGKLRGRSHLLMIDQIHNLCGAKDDVPLYLLADIYDQTETAQLWAGTADLLKYLTQGQANRGDESLAQIRSRISPCVNLLDVLGEHGSNGGEPLFTLAQIREVFARNKLKLTPNAAKWLCTLANLPDGGGLRSCVQIIDFINAVAEAKNWTSIDVPQLKASARYNLPSERCQLILQRVEAHSKQQPLRAAVG